MNMKLAIREWFRRRHFGHDETGASAVEFAFAVPFVLLLLSGAIDLGLALNQSSSLSNAARAGAQYGMRFPSDSDGITQAVIKSANYDPTTLTISSQLTCECADKQIVACTDTCGNATPRSYVTVNVSMPYSSPLPTAMLLGINTVSGSAVFRAN
jgi:Flp pilus assembly protein TadG